MAHKIEEQCSETVSTTSTEEVAVQQSLLTSKLEPRRELFLGLFEHGLTLLSSKTQYSHAVDTKHESLKSRRDFFEIRRSFDNATLQGRCMRDF